MQANSVGRKIYWERIHGPLGFHIGTVENINNKPLAMFALSVLCTNFYTHTHMHAQTDTHKDTQTDTQTDTHTDTHTNMNTDTDTHAQMHTSVFNSKTPKTIKPIPLLFTTEGSCQPVAFCREKGSLGMKASRCTL